MNGSGIRMGYLLLAGMISGLYLGQVQAASVAAQEVAGTLASSVVENGVTVDVKNLERQLSQQQNTVYGEQQLTTLRPVCNTCTVTWTSTAKELTGVNTMVLGSKPYLFASGIQGVALSVRPTDNGELWVGLMNSSQVTEGDVAGNITLPGLSRLEKGPDGITHNYPVILTGKIIAPACEMKSGQDLDFSLPQVTKSALMSVKPGEPLQAISASASLSLRCAMNAELTMKFQGTYPEGFPGVLKATSDSNLSADSGVGFIVKATDNGTAAIWDNVTALTVPVAPGQVSVPFTAMYTRTGGDIIPGEVRALGTIYVTLP
ncbi:fimbrial protein [Salmonella enterica]|nr:fimbrial protein [Salmonella enterica]